MVSKYICKIERWISTITSIKWMQCSNCKYYEYVEVKSQFSDKMVKRLRCKITKRFPYSWQYCCLFDKRKKEIKNKPLDNRLALDKAIKKHDRIMNLIYSKERDIKALTENVKEVDNQIEYLKRQLGES